jgi:hypothetical protein
LQLAWYCVTCRERWGKMFHFRNPVADEGLLTQPSL